jgi:hypothetical protein
MSNRRAILYGLKNLGDLIVCKVYLGSKELQLEEGYELRLRS